MNHQNHKEQLGKKIKPPTAYFSTFNFSKNLRHTNSWSPTPIRNSLTQINISAYIITPKLLLSVTFLNTQAIYFKLIRRWHATRPLKSFHPVFANICSLRLKIDFRGLDAEDASTRYLYIASHHRRRPRLRSICSGCEVLNRTRIFCLRQ